MSILFTFFFFLPFSGGLVAIFQKKKIILFSDGFKTVTVAIFLFNLIFGL